MKYHHDPDLLQANKDATGVFMKPQDQQTLLIALYKENCEHGRHHETQREKVTALVASTTGVVLGLLALGKGTMEMTGPAAYLLPVFIMLLGFWGYWASWKHNERSRLHRKRTGEIRAKLAELSGLDLSQINEAAREKHRQDYDKSCLIDLPLNIIWKWFHFAIIGLGAAFFIMMLFRGNPVPPQAVNGPEKSKPGP